MRETRKGGWIVGSIAALAVISGAAFAGAKTNNQVIIDDNNRSASGGLGAVYNSLDNQQYIGCYTYTGFAMCFARNSAGLTRTCTTTDPETIAVVRSMSGDASLRFEWEVNGTCRNGGVSVSHYSHTRPKNP